MAENLWGEIKTDAHSRAPVTILKEQATILGELTNRILEGVVETTRPSTSNTGFISYGLFVVAPALGNYQYNIIDVEHDPILIYPVKVYDMSSRGSAAGLGVELCENEETLVKQVGRILSSSKVQTVITSLLAQSQAAE